MFATYRHSPALQRQIAVVAAVVSGLSVTAMRLRAMSLIDAPDGDTYLAPFARSEWREVAREDHPAEERRPAFSFVRLERASR